MALSKSKQTTKSNQTATVAPNAVYAPQIDAAADTLRPAYDTAQANAASLMPRVNSVLDYYGTQLSNPIASNPYLDSIIKRTGDDITNRVSGQFSQAGRYGSGAYTGTLAKALADNESGLRYQDYSAGQARQDAAARGILGATGVSAALPQAAAGTYADQVRALLSQYTTGTQQGTSVTKSSPILLSILAQAAGNAAATYAGGG